MIDFKGVVLPGLYMSAAWATIYLGILAQHLADGYTFNIIWMGFVVPLLLRFVASDLSPNPFMLRWQFLIIASTISTIALAAFMNITPKTSKGVKEFGKNTSANRHVITMFLITMFLIFFILSQYMRVYPLEVNVSNMNAFN